MTDGWKEHAINRIEETIESLSTHVALGSCPVCTYVHTSHEIIADNPDNGCYDENGDVLCPATNSCQVYTDICEWVLGDQVDMYRNLIEMIGKDDYSAHVFYTDEDDGDDWDDE